MKQYMTVLQMCGLFAGIAENQLLTMLSCLGATVRSYEKNQIISLNGTLPFDVYLWKSFIRTPEFHHPGV